MAQTYTDADFRDRVIRSSKLKTLEGCSYLYYACYVLGLPQKANSGQEKGSICHDILEMLSRPKHKKAYKKIMKRGSVFAHVPAQRLVLNYINKTQTLEPIDADHIDQMIMVGLNTDYWVKGGKIISHEHMFEITNEEPFYRIKGFFDKVSIKGGYTIIDDYKSSKRQFVGQDRESNLQAMIYSLAAKKLWPDSKPKVRFIFLQYPDDPIMEIEFTEDVLKGFETYLALVQEKIDVFSAKDAIKDMAAYKEIPSTGEFKGKLLCGFAKSPNQLKKDGTRMWHCPMKFGFTYGAIKKDGKVISTCFEDKIDKIILKDGETIERLAFGGCPHYNKVDVLSDMKATVVPKYVSKDFFADF